MRMLWKLYYLPLRVYMKLKIFAWRWRVNQLLRENEKLHKQWTERHDV